MALTGNGFFYPTGLVTDSIKSLMTQAANAADLTLVNRQAYTWRWASQTEQDATTAAGLMREGDLGLRTDQKITYQRIGAAWRAWSSDWIIYTAARTNITLAGAQTFNTRYRYVNGMVEVEYATLIVSGSSLPGTPEFTTPTSINLSVAGFGYTTNFLPYDGDGVVYINAGQILRGGVLQSATSASTRVVLAVQVYFSGAPDVRWAILNNTTPVNLIAGMIIRGTFRYQPV